MKVTSLLGSAAVLTAVLSASSYGHSGGQRLPETVSTPWELVSTSRDGRALTLRYATLSILKLEEVKVREAGDHVEIGVHQRAEPPKGGWTSFVGHGTTTVTLAEPLAPRRLRHSEVTRNLDFGDRSRP